MWLFTPFGFFSVVQKKPGDALTIRARARGDLDALRAKYLPTLSPTVANAGSDYRYRATASHADVAAAMSKIVVDIDYSNFKSKVARELGSKRAGVYHDVWHDLLQLEK